MNDDLNNDEVITLESLIGKDLSNFKIEKRTGVYMTDNGGRRVNSISCFKDSDIAKAFAKNQTDSDYRKYHIVLILTDGKRGLLLDGVEPVRIIEDEKAVLEIRQKIIQKLNSEEVKVLGI